MKLPFLPIYIDSFARDNCAAQPQAAPPNDAAGNSLHDVGALYFLSHAHTDHTAGLTAHWQGGHVLCTSITRDVVVQRLQDELSQKGACVRPDEISRLFARFVVLPLWERVPLLSAMHSPGRPEGVASSPAPAVHVTLVPAFHIPGSVMLYFETPLGRILYTGDFKYAAGIGAPVLSDFFRTHPVDHLYFDDTWLHLGMTVASHVAEEAELSHADRATTRDGAREPFACGGEGTKVLSKLLNEAQVSEVVEAIGRRLDAQRRRFADTSGRRRAYAPPAGEPSSAAPPRPPLPARPFVLRVYLHNQFGKEMLIQRIAQRLGTTAALDDARYARVATVSAALCGEDIDDSRSSCTSTDQEDDISAALYCNSATAPHAHTGEKRRECDIYSLDLRYFTSFSQREKMVEELRHLVSSVGSEATEPGRTAAQRRYDDLLSQLPLVEVVGSRREISPLALQAGASQSSPMTPHYAVVMSGWARLQRNRDLPAEVWHVPTTLHCTPQEIIDFVRLLRPLSATPLHYRPSRSATVLMQRLGPHLRRPFVNDVLAIDPRLAGKRVRDTKESAAYAPSALSKQIKLGYSWLCLVKLPAPLPMPSSAIARPRRLGYAIRAASVSPVPSEEEHCGSQGCSCTSTAVDPFLSSARSSSRPVDGCRLTAPPSDREAERQPQNPQLLELVSVGTSSEAYIEVNAEEGSC